MDEITKQPRIIASRLRSFCSRCANDVRRERIFSDFPESRIRLCVFAKSRYTNLIRNSVLGETTARNLYTRTPVSIVRSLARLRASRVVYLRSVRRVLSTAAAGMMKERGTSLRNRRTIPPRPLISIVYACRLFKRELNILRYILARDTFREINSFAN